MEDTPSPLGKVVASPVFFIDNGAGKPNGPVLKIELYVRVCISYPASASFDDAFCHLKMLNASWWVVMGHDGVKKHRLGPERSGQQPCLLSFE